MLVRLTLQSYSTSYLLLYTIKAELVWMSGLSLSEHIYLLLSLLLFEILHRIDQMKERSIRAKRRNECLTNRACWGPSLTLILTHQRRACWGPAWFAFPRLEKKRGRGLWTVDVYIWLAHYAGTRIGAREAWNTRTLPAVFPSTRI